MKNEARRTPALAYDVKHVTINMKVEHYKRMRRDGVNMSRVINTFLDDLYGYSICPHCYGDNIEVRTCAKCEGRMLICLISLALITAMVSGASA